MKKSIAWMCVGVATACFSGAAGAQSAWVGCYVATGRGFDSGRTKTEAFEVRQEGNTLYWPVGMEGKQETRMIMKPASPEELLALKQRFLGADFKGEVSSGLAVYAVSIGSDVKPAAADRGLRMGLYWVSPAGEEKGLYLFAPFAFDKTTKVPCPGKK